MARTCSCDHLVRDESSIAFFVGWAAISRRQMWVLWVAQLEFIDGLAPQTASARIATGKSAFAKDPHLKKIIILFFEDMPFLPEFYIDSTA